MPGNQFGDKLNQKQKQLAFKQYCDHVASGLSKEAWWYDDPDDENFSIGYRTIESYMKASPEALRPSQLERAYAQSRKLFERIGMEMMTGENPNGNPAIFQIFMRNKFGWDKELQNNDKNKSIFNEELGKIKNKDNME